jgi:hypothetical protein
MKRHTPLPGVQRKEYIMRTFTIFAAIGVFALAAGGEEFRVTHREKAAGDAMDFESKHLSIEQCDSMNYTVGRDMKWNNRDEAFIDTDAAVETLETNVGAREALTTENTSAWVSEIQKKGETYQTEKKQRAKKYQDRLSDYSQTELSIAKNMGLDPWDIDREQLRLWGRETDTILSRL